MTAQLYQTEHYENRPVSQREIINNFYQHQVKTYALMDGTLYTTDGPEWIDTSLWTLTDLLNYLAY